MTEEVVQYTGNVSFLDAKGAALESKVFGPGSSPSMLRLTNFYASQAFGQAELPWESLDIKIVRVRPAAGV